MSDKTIDPELLAWVVETVRPGEAPAEVRGLRSGDMPWLVAFDGLEVVLRTSNDAAAIVTERGALELAASSGLPVPQVLGSRLPESQADGQTALLLIEKVSGSSMIPREVPVARLRALGDFVARLHAIPTPSAFARRDRSISEVDFAQIRARSEPRELLVRAEAAVAGYEPTGEDGFVHGDLWQGNSLWNGEALSAVIDWDCAGTGKAGLDLASLRMDAALCFGGGAEKHVLAGWQATTGREPLDLAYWDLMASLSTPPDLGWFVETTRDQGRPDLTQELMIARRDELLEDALRRAGA